MIDRIIAIASQFLPGEIGPDTRWSDLGADSMDLIEIECALDEAFGNDLLTLPDGFLAGHKTPRLAAEAMKEMV